MFYELKTLLQKCTFSAKALAQNTLLQNYALHKKLKKGAKVG